MDVKGKIILFATFILYYCIGISGQLLFDLKNGYKPTQNVTLNDTSTQAQPTNITSDGKLCDPNVQQHSGYINFSGSLGAKSYFFWLLESRSEPSSDPLVIWLTGGPGCSSQMALLMENGPCLVNKDGNGTTLNEFSWTNKANVMWVDQPAGTGFSSGNYVHNENGVQEDFYAFLEEFYKQLPKYKNNSLYITGESYAGHYVPAISHYIWKMNKNVTEDAQIPLKGLAIGNGLTNVELQYTAYPDMALDGGKSQGGSLKEGVITNRWVQDLMRAGVTPCTLLVNECNAGNGFISTDACLGAFIVCNYAETVPYQLSGYNPYDMRIKCEKLPLCYDFSNIEKYLNRDDVKEVIGAKGNWQSCNMLVNKLFMADFMTSFHQGIPDLLHDGLEVLIYAGDVDYICNWLGNKKWVKALEWEGKENFNLAEDKPWNLTTGETMGRIRAYKNFKFLQVYNAGHMVPMDQPQAASQMLNAFLDGSLGEEKYWDYPNQEILDDPNIVVVD